MNVASNLVAAAPVSAEHEASVSNADHAMAEALAMAEGLALAETFAMAEALTARAVCATKAPDRGASG